MVLAEVLHYDSRIVSEGLLVHCSVANYQSPITKRTEIRGGAGIRTGTGIRTGAGTVLGTGIGTGGGT